MAVIDKSVTNHYYCGNPELVTAIDRLTDAVKTLKPAALEITQKDISELSARQQTLIKNIESMFTPPPTS